MEVTSNCDVTNSAHQMQMTTIWPWTKTPHENFLRTPLNTRLRFFRKLLFQKLLQTVTTSEMVHFISVCSLLYSFRSVTSDLGGPSLLACVGVHATAFAVNVPLVVRQHRVNHFLEPAPIKRRVKLPHFTWSSVMSQGVKHNWPGPGLCVQTLVYRRNNESVFSSRRAEIIVPARTSLSSKRKW